MKKINSGGFVLAETLVVTVFLMTIFSMLYYYFYPLIGEYEKREVYDDVDDKYSAFWIKKIIEDSEYVVDSDSVKGRNFEKYGYFRFECKEISSTSDKKQMCKNLVNALQVDNCDPDGNNCSIYVTSYRIGFGANRPAQMMRDFKTTVSMTGDQALIRAQEDCDKTNLNECINDFVTNCKEKSMLPVEKAEVECSKEANKKIFPTRTRDYVELLPDYKTKSRNGAFYRIIVVFHHVQVSNNYYSYATIEVNV